MLFLVPSADYDIVLHPQYKTEYFVEEDWEEDWITEARNIITEQWNKYYRDNDVAQEVQAPVSSASVDYFATDMTIY